MLPSGIHANPSELPRWGEVLAENPARGLLARGSMPLQYFVDFKKPEGKALTRFSLGCEKQKKKKRGGVRIP
jgi:hypothetical protein